MVGISVFEIILTYVTFGSFLCDNREYCYWRKTDTQQQKKNI